MGVSAFRFPIVGVLSLVAISTTHCTVHMSDMSVAWGLGSVGTCNISVSREWDGHGRSEEVGHDVIGTISSEYFTFQTATCSLTLANGEQKSYVLSYGDAAKTNTMLTAWRVRELARGLLF